MDYKHAGVDIEAGYKSVELMKEHVKKTLRPEVLTGLGGFSTAFGFFIAIVLMAGIREKIEYNDIPKTFRGTAIVLITACLMSIAFMGFSGMI